MNEEQIHKWLELYEVGLEISSATSLERRKREAVDYADLEFPQAKELRKRVGEFLHSGNRDVTPEQVIALGLVRGTGPIVRRFLDKYPEYKHVKRQKIEPVIVSKIEPKPSINGQVSVVEAYMSWLQAHDEIPPDAVLAHFLGCTHGAAASARREAIREGYVFEHQHGGNWRVVSRPSSKKPKISKHGETPTPEEINRVVKFLLKEKRHA